MESNGEGETAEKIKSKVMIFVVCTWNVSRPINACVWAWHLLFLRTPVSECVLCAVTCLYSLLSAHMKMTALRSNRWFSLAFYFFVLFFLFFWGQSIFFSLFVGMRTAFEICERRFSAGERDWNFGFLIKCHCWRWERFGENVLCASEFARRRNVNVSHSSDVATMMPVTREIIFKINQRCRSSANSSH